VIHFTCVVGNPAFSRSLACAAKELDRRFKGEVSLVYFLYSRRQRLPAQQLKRLEENIKKADVILTSMVFEGQPLDLIRKFGGGKTVIVLAGTPQALALTRLGKFNFGSFLESTRQSKVARAVGFLRRIVSSAETRREVRTLLDHLDTPLKILRFGKWKDAGNYLKIFKYSVNRGDENILNLFLFILKEYFDYNVAYKEPKVVSAEFCYHPRAPSHFHSTGDYLEWYRLFLPQEKKMRPLVGVLTNHDQVIVNDLDDVTVLIERLEAKGVGVLPVSCNATNAFKAMQQFFMEDGQSFIDAMVSLLNFRLEGGPLGGDYEACLAFCQRMNVPLIKALTLGLTSLVEWQQSQTGLTPIETTLSLCLPELDGLIEGRLISAKKEEGSPERPVKVNQPLDERIARASTRITNWVALRKKRNEDKKIAFILYNYPPGKDRIGNAASLNTMESLIALLERMGQEGYTVHGFPKTKHEFIRLITKKNLLNQANWATLAKVKEHAVKVPVTKYLSWFQDIPQVSQERMISEWGDPPGNIMADEEHLFIPGLSFGSVFVGFQPTRGYHEDTSKITHDQALPPHHQYLAFYRWIEREFQADAVIHLGTHGTLEFLPGKQMAMSETCFPDMLIGSLVNIYVYLTSGIAEGMIARRRTSAALLNHMTPPLVTSRLYEKLLELEGEIQNYYPLKDTSPGRAEQVLEKIREMAQEENLVDLEADTVDVDKLYSDIMAMKGTLMPQGNHVLGRSLQGEALEEFIAGILRYDRPDITAVPTILARTRDINLDEGRLHPATVMPNGVLMGMALDQIEEESKAIIRHSLKVKRPLKKWIKKYTQANLSRADLKALETSLNYGSQLAGMLTHNTEIDQLMRYLSGEFVSSGVGGDPVRDPHVIPTGRNMYQFNPELIPTSLACERGAVVANQVLHTYQEMNETQGYPETVGVVLWGLETMRTQGETVGEIMSLIGVQPMRSNIGQIVGVVPIPLEKLKRPRLDVLVEISGIFRDTLPETLRLLDQAFRMVARLPEPEDQNYIKKHCHTIKKALEQKGMTPGDAQGLAQSRIFGPSGEKYATDVTNLIETSEWEHEEEISTMHLSSMSHVYGETFHGASHVSAFEEVLNTVDIVSQVRDTDERGMTDLDHYYEFLGGLSKAAETVRQKRAAHTRKALITVVPDTTRKRIETRDIKSQVKLEAKTRLLNPQWSEGMIKSGYQGVAGINERLQNLLGWSATTHAVDTWVYSRVAERYLFNDEIRKQMIQENIWSVEDSLKRLMEAYQRGMWEATDAEIEKLKKIYLELESEIEEREE
jgi:magnesium chelatase H subunit